MKLRIRKLLAAALVICLVVAMVPGAALAAGTVATVPAGANNPADEFETLEAAITAAGGRNDAANRVVTLSSDYTLSSSCTLPDAVSLIIASGATLTINPGVTFTVQGPLTLNGSIEVAAGNQPSAGGEVSFSRTFNGSGSIDVGASGEVTLASGQTIGGSLTTAGPVSASGELTVSGSATVEAGGSLSASKLNVTTGRFTNSGTVSASGGITVNRSGSFTHNAGSGSITGALDVYGNLEVSGTYNQSSNITVYSGGIMSVSGDYTAANLTVGGTLNITRGEFDAGTSFTVSNGAEVNVSGGAELNIQSVPTNGTISVDGSTLNVNNVEMIGPNSLSGDAEVATVSGKTVITVNRGTVSGSRSAGNAYYTVSNDEMLVVGGSLTVAYPMSISGELVVDGTLTVNANNSLTVNSEASLSGSGRIDANGPLYVLNNSAAGNLNIYIGQNGGVYAKNNAIDVNVVGGIATTNPAPDRQVYNYAKVYSQGNTYYIELRVGNNGEATLADSAVEQTTVNFTATPAEGYEVDPSGTYYVTSSVSDGPVAVDGNRLSFVMPSSDVTVYVAFREAENSSSVTQGNITVATNHNGNGTVNASINGRVVTVTVRANTNYVINTVSIAGRGQTVATDAKSGTYSYTVPGTGNATVEVYVTFKSDDFEVTLTNYTYDDGRISLSSGTTTTGRYAEGQRVYIYAYPDRDFYVRSLTITRTDNRQTVNYYESSSSDDVFYFDMPASDVTVRAYFTDGVYEIATDIDGSGRLTITGEDGNVTDVAEEGEEIRITASPSNNYRLGDLYVTYTDSDDEDQVIYPEVEYKNNGNVDYYWFEMPEYDVEIYADFGEGDYVAWIDRSDMENGTIRVSPNVADEDDTVSIYVTPDTGYQLDELIVEDEDGHDVTTTSLASGTRYTFRMPDSDVTVTATFKSRSYSSNFTDVPRYEWYYEAVSYVASEGLMNGVSTTQFNPNGTASRAQIVTILWRLAGEPSALTGAFTDVPAGQYYSTAVAWASRQGIVTGVGNNRFEPNSNITREQLAVILYRYAQDAGYTTSASANITGYYDYARVNSYARTAMSWAVGAGLITGTSTTTLSPQDTATRAQVATILMRFCENIAK